MKMILLLTLIFFAPQIAISQTIPPQTAPVSTEELQAKFPSNEYFILKCGMTGLSQTKVLNGKAIELIKPKYSKKLQKKRITGFVSVAVQVEDGKVISASATSGHPLLRKRAVKAARKSTFKKFVDCRGNLVKKVNGTIIFNFVLAE